MLPAEGNAVRCGWRQRETSWDSVRRIPRVKNESGGTLGAVFDLCVAFGDLINWKHKIIYNRSFQSLGLVYMQKIKCI